MPLGVSERWEAARSGAASDTTEDEEDGGASHLTGQLDTFRRLFTVFDSNQDGFLDR